MECTEEVVEKLAAVLVRVQAVVDVGLEPGVHVPVVQLAVQGEECLVCQGRPSA
jgi:hypothetical protein